MSLAFIVNGIIFAAALWVGFACVRRLNLLHWREHDALTIVAYVAIAVWAATYVIGLPELQHFGIVGVAILFFTGRKRWLSKAPEDITARGATR
jgi:hypothetical protein